MKKQLHLLLFLFCAFFLRAQPGALDVTFSEDGFFLNNFEYVHTRAEQILVQSDGKIIVGTVTGLAGVEEYTVVTRYFPDGALDSTFHGDGRIFMKQQNQQMVLADMLLLPDDKILLGVNSIDILGIYRVLLFQYNADGTPDAGFGLDGMIGTQVNGIIQTRLSALTRQSDGKIVASGNAMPTMGPLLPAVFRYFQDGTLDQTLAGNGIATIDHAATVYAVAAQPDAKILLAGQSYEGDVFIVRLNPEGIPDPAFAGQGINIIPLSSAGDGITGLHLLPDGKILAGGFAQTAASGTFDFMAMRLLPNGMPDPAFSGDGVAYLDVAGNKQDAPRCMLVQSDGKILLGGFAIANSKQQMALARFDTNGATDVSFGTGGKMIYELFPGTGNIFCLAMQQDGKILAGGNYAGNSTEYLSVMRILAQDAVATHEQSFVNQDFQIFPNPATNQVNLRYSLTQPATFAVRLYDLNGKVIRTLRPMETRSAGQHVESFHLDTALPSGLYVVEIESAQEKKRITLVKK